MPTSNSDKEFVDFIVELTQSIGPSYAKSMFGGHGVFLDGLMFGLIADGVLYLKADEQTQKNFTAKGLGPFTYNKKGKDFKMSYYQAPEEALENEDDMQPWARDAFDVALRAASKKRKK